MKDNIFKNDPFGSAIGGAFEKMDTMSTGSWGEKKKPAAKKTAVKAHAKKTGDCATVAKTTKKTTATQARKPTTKKPATKPAVKRTPPQEDEYVIVGEIITIEY